MKWYTVPLDTANKVQYMTPGEILEIRIAGRKLCLAKTAENLFAFTARCPHAGLPLKMGCIDQGRIICAFHRHSWDLATGVADADHRNNLKTYPVRATGTGYEIGMQKRSWL